MRSKKLSICIPTYNRALLLKECVESFLPEAVKYDIPIFISDNASSDNTKDVVEKLREVYPDIIYSRNQSTIVVQLHQGDFVVRYGVYVVIR